MTFCLSIHGSRCNQEMVEQWRYRENWQAFTTKQVPLIPLLWLTPVILTLGGGSNRIRSSRPASGTQWVPSQPGIHYNLSQINTHKLKSASPGAPTLVFLAALRSRLALTYLPSRSRKSRHKTSKQPKHTNRWHFSNQPPSQARPAPFRRARFRSDGNPEGPEDPRWVGLDVRRSKLGPRPAELLFRELASCRKCDSEGRGGVQQLGDVVPGGVYAVVSDFLGT